MKNLVFLLLGAGMLGQGCASKSNLVLERNNLNGAKTSIESYLKKFTPSFYESMTIPKKVREENFYTIQDLKSIGKPNGLNPLNNDNKNFNLKGGNNTLVVLTMMAALDSGIIKKHLPSAFAGGLYLTDKEEFNSKYNGAVDFLQANQANPSYLFNVLTEYTTLCGYNKRQQESFKNNFVGFLKTTGWFANNYLLGNGSSGSKGSSTNTNSGAPGVSLEDITNSTIK